MVKQLKKRTLAEGRFLHLVEEDGWEYVQRPHISGIVVLIPITDQNELILVEQFRRPVNAHVIELPAGLAGDTADFSGETLQKAALRELEEETGYRSTHLHLVTKGPPSPGISAEIIHIFLATGLEKVGAGGGDENEDIKVHKVPFAHLEEWLARKANQPGIMVDPKVYMGAWFARVYH